MMLPSNEFSTRAKAITLRTYHRPLDEAGDTFESWAQTIERSTYEHHKKLWQDAGGNPNENELNELRQLGLDRKGLVSGRTLWLGGTPYAYSRACSQFNCAESKAQTVYDVVDISWLLLNGCGVGFRPQVGTLHGYTRPVPGFEIIPSTRDKEYRGPEDNKEVLPTEANGFTWTIKVGDSAQAWAKAAGKLLNPNAHRASKLVLDFSKVRGSVGLQMVISLLQSAWKHITIFLTRKLVTFLMKSILSM